MEEFNVMSVEDFGPALLAGMGWVEGKGIGKNAKEDVKIVEYKQWTTKEGLGFVGELPTKGINRKKDTKGLDKKNENDKEKEKHEKKNVQRDNMKGSPSLSWLNSHIIVRIVSKELKKGSLYLHKGEMIDVVGPTTCDISMDKSKELINGVDQKFLETAFPRLRGPVLVLSGRHKGVYGSLVEKDMENENAFVREADSHELIKVHLEQIAEYIGDPSEIGY